MAQDDARPILLPGRPEVRGPDDQGQPGRGGEGHVAGVIGDRAALIEAGDVAGPQVQRVLDPQALDFDLHAAEQAAHHAAAVGLRHRARAQADGVAASQVAHDELSRLVALDHGVRARDAGVEEDDVVLRPPAHAHGKRGQDLLAHDDALVQDADRDHRASTRCVEPSARSVNVRKDAGRTPFMCTATNAATLGWVTVVATKS